MIFEDILRFLDARMETPTIFSWFHLMFLGITAISIILLVVFRKKLNEKSVNKILIIWAIIALLLEIYKQFNFSFNSTTGVWDYQWYAFPFQFCSTPIYIAFVASLLKKGKVKDYLISYLATFALFAGLAVTFYPGNVFISTIGINIQTMFVHCGMVFIGVLLWLSGQVKFSLKTLFKGTIIFFIMLAIASLLNFFVYLTGLCGSEDFNMFYISPYFTSALPILDTIQASFPYVLFLLIYIFAFTLAGFIVIMFAMLIRNIFNPKNKKKIT